MASVAAACGPGGETGSGTGPIPPTTVGSGGGGNGGTGGNGGDGGGGPGCPENATRDCHVTLGQHGDILSCFDGVQACKGGEWGPCSDGVETERPAPRPTRPDSRSTSPDTAGARGVPPGQHTMVLGGAVAGCVNNPCDPSCQVFAEVPGSPLESPPQNLLAPWQSGSYGNLPPAIANEGTKEPCVKGEDCQFDQYCDNPPSGTCSHHKCVTGVGLQKTCDSCVTDICSSNPSCCSPGVGLPACSHDLCTIGVALKSTVAPTLPCDPCVNTICANPAYAACCNTSTGYWTDDCVAAVTSVCGKSCGSWTQGCVNQVATRCGATCLTDPGPPACAHDKCYLGGKLDAACDPCVAAVCAADSFCCSGTWDGKCLQEVASVCGEQCPSRGNCVPWLPTQVDPACAPFDLTAGVGCTIAGIPQVPVCNHGQASAPAGLPIVVLPAAPVQLPSCYPALGGGTTVVTPSAIAPGQCIDVALPVGTPEGAQIVANPFGAAGFSNAECHCSNNWSVWSSATGACGTPSCAGASAFAKLKKVKLFITVDKSASQNFVMSGLAGSPTRWSQLKGALSGFITDPGSDQIGVWMRFWPYNVGANNPVACPSPYFGCGAGGCTTPNADVADLASAANETALLMSLNAVVPSDNTPMFPALDGALQAATAYQIANPDTAAAVLMITDGNPTQCSTGNAAIASLPAAAFSAYGVRTYVIGIADVSQTTVELIAGAGGGKSFFVGSGVGVPIQQQVLAALDSIKQDFVSCTLVLPNQDIFDPSKAVMTYTPNAGAAMNVPKVANLAACGGASGWYYDNPADPASITMCPKLCSALKEDINGAIELKIECLSQYLPKTFKYEYEATCPQGTIPQWGYFAYNTQTPGDSRVTFRAHTAATNSFGAAPATILATAQAAPNTQVCAMGGPAPCPIDLYNGLGGLPAARRNWLQLVMDIAPTSNTNQTPQIDDWQVTYSCVDAE